MSSLVAAARVCVYSREIWTLAELDLVITAVVAQNCSTLLNYAVHNWANQHACNENDANSSLGRGRAPKIYTHPHTVFLCSCLSVLVALLLFCLQWLGCFCELWIPPDVSAATITPISQRATASFILELLLRLQAFSEGASTGIKSYAFCSTLARRRLHIILL